MRTAVFDLDGTLANTSLDLVAAANKTFCTLGFYPILDPEKDETIVKQGGGMAMLRKGFETLGVHRTDADILKLYPTLIDAYATSLCEHSYLYTGCIDALERLQADGVKLAVCTNKPGVLAVPLLAELGIAEFFGIVIAADTLAVRKPKPEPFFACVDHFGGKLKQSVLIGDTATDRETAKAAGVPSVLVTFGPLGSAVAEYEPDAFLDKYDEIEQVLASLENWNMA